MLLRSVSQSRYVELKSARDYYEGGFCGTYKTWVTGYDEKFIVLFHNSIILVQVSTVIFLRPMLPIFLFQNLTLSECKRLTVVNLVRL